MNDAKRISFSRRGLRHRRRALLNVMLIIASYQLCVVLAIYFNIFFG